MYLYRDIREILRVGETRCLDVCFGMQGHRALYCHSCKEKRAARATQRAIALCYRNANCVKQQKIPNVYFLINSVIKPIALINFRLPINPLTIYRSKYFVEFINFMETKRKKWE